VPTSPLTPHRVIVQSRGVATWLSMYLAERFGVWAHCSFFHPQQMIQEIVAAVAPEHAKDLEGFDRQRLTLAILAEFPSLDREVFRPLADYLGDDPHGLKAVQLARQLAALFDRYAVFRPEMLLSWEDGRFSGDLERLFPWQQALWQRLAKRLFSPPRLLLDVQERLKSGPPEQEDCRRQPFTLFAITSLPPLYLALLNVAAGWLEIECYLFTPGTGYFADQVRMRGKGGEATGEEADLLETHPLLGSWGGLAREFQRNLEEFLEMVEDDEEDPHATGKEPPATILARLQHDIIHLVVPPGDLPFPAGDRSLSIHSCHSPLREVEVLRDQVLAMIDEDGYAPHDILVLVVDIDSYAPLIEAVFSRPLPDGSTIPFSIADRTLGSQSRIAQAVHSLLETASGRLTAREVATLLEIPLIARRFGIHDLDRVLSWITSTNIRWGIDPEHRARFSMAETPQNTWRLGLDRLIAGYAAGGGGDRIFGGILAYDDIEGQDAHLLSGLLSFLDSLFKLARSLASRRNITQWSSILLEAMDTFFVLDQEEEQAASEIVNLLARLGLDAEALGCDHLLDFEGFLHLFRSRLELVTHDRGFLSSGITFCAMQPMRTIPSPVICLLGMNDGAFPRNEVRPGFDLMAQHRRCGDRDRRLDDRAMFLETVLSCRKKLLISYVGRSIRDNSRIPPASVVDELLDCLAATYTFPGTGGGTRAENRRQLMERLVVEHPLQPFSPSYFNNAHPRLFSYDHLSLRGLAHSREKEVHPPPPFVAGSLVSSHPDLFSLSEISLEGLKRFFADPVRWFLHQGLSLKLVTPEEGIQEMEPLSLDGLERYRAGLTLLDHEGADEATLYALLQAMGILPWGNAGKNAFRRLLEMAGEVRRLVETAGRSRGEPRRIAFHLPSGRRCSGLIEGFDGKGVVRLVVANKIRARHRLDCWIDHLACCGARLAQAPESLLVAAAQEPLVYAPPAERPEALLSRLVELLHIGQGLPIPFFPEPSLAYADAVRAGKSSSEALAAAKRRAGEMRRFLGRGEEWPPEVRLVFGDRDPLEDPLFAEASCAVFLPLLEASEELR